MEYKDKRFLAKLRSPFRRVKKRFFTPKAPVLTEMQLLVLRNTKALIRNPRSTLLIDPITGIRYIRLDEFKIKFGHSFIYTKRTFVTESGAKHVESNYYEINFVTAEKLLDFFDRKVSERRKEMDAEDDLIIIENLQNMHETIISMTHNEDNK